MKMVAKTDEYTIYQKRNQRYSVRNGARQWVNGDEKVAILTQHKLIEIKAPKKAEPAPEAPAEATDEADASAE